MSPHISILRAGFTASAIVRRALAPAFLLAVLMLVFGGRFALAAFTADADSEATIGTAALVAPKSVSATQVNCQRNGSVEIELSWSATSSTFATSYTLERSNSGSGPYTKLANISLSTLSYIDSSSLTSSSTYYYRVSVVYMSWSASITTSVGTLNKQCR